MLPMKMRRSALVPSLMLVALLLPLAIAPATAQDAGRWFHVQVHDGSDRVQVNLPLSLVEKALEMIPADLSDEVRIELNEQGFDVQELRELWQELRNSEDATFATVESDGEKITVRKEGEYFIAKTVESRSGGTEVNVRFPLDVVDALFNEDSDEIDLPAAVRALARYDGDMVSVRDGETRVRVWVDDRNESGD